MIKWYEKPVGKEILQKKYLHDGETSFKEMSERISACFSSLLQGKIKIALLNADFFPAGRSLYTLGCKGKFSVTPSNCYILPSPEDDLSSIFEVGKAMAIIFSKGGGCGINLSKLRPRGALVRNMARTSTGVAGFVEYYDAVCSVISQNGRRGALLIGLNCDHPDVEEFVKIKQNNEAIQSSNLSMVFDDAFMQAAEAGDLYLLKFDATPTGEKIRHQINASDFFQQFCSANREYAEPGAIFIDRARSWNLLSSDPDYRIEIANPCGEFFGNAYSSCNLGSCNLYSLIRDKFTETAELDLSLLRERVNLAVEVLDEILDYGLDLQPLAENVRNIKDYRNIGLGVFGLADALVALGIRYGSQQCIAFCASLFREMFLQALRTSNRLAREKGAFDKCRPEILLKAPILRFLEETDPQLRESIRQFGLRNASLISIAPTGTISTMCGFSGGIEPLYRISYRRTTHSLAIEGRYFEVYAKSVMDMVEASSGKLEGMPVDELQKMFPYIVTAHEIDPVDRLRVQAAIQQYVDNAISSTVNMHSGSTVEEVRKVYKTAWKLGCKGVTVFVEGCRRTAILTR